MKKSTRTATLTATVICLMMAFISKAPLDLQSRAKSERKYIAVYFSGSDWCSICHHFKKKVLDVRLTDSLLTHHYVYYNADFPQRKKLEKQVTADNEELAGKLNKEGVFPLLVIADADWNVKAKIRGNAKQEEVIASLQTFQAK